MSTVTVQLTSEGILEGFIGRSVNRSKDDEFVNEVEAAGSVSEYIKGHPVYRHMGDSHKATAIACFISQEMRDAVSLPYTVAEDRNLIVRKIDPETGEAVPWNDVEVAV